MIKKIIHNLYLNYSYKKIIRTDNKDSFLTREEKYKDYIEEADDLKKNGAVEIDEFYKNQNLSNQLENFCDEKINKVDEKNPINSFTFVNKKNFVAEKILSNPKINFLIRDYLGKNARLDLINLSITKNKSLEKIISEKWHYDNVGRRIKLFFYLNDNNDICTDYVKKSHTTFHNNYTTEGSRRDENYIQNFQDETISYFPKKNCILIFDSNGYHRGNYRNSLRQNTDINNLSYRKMLKLEFSNKIKSELFYGKSNIIGVRGTIFSNDFNFSVCPLIDQKLLSNIDDKYFLYDNQFKKYNDY